MGLASGARLSTGAGLFLSIIDIKIRFQGLGK
jgi:hypothetical protein